MNLEIIKKGQGGRARGLAYLLSGGIVLYGAIALYATINRPGENVFISKLPVIGDLSLYKIIAVVVFGVGLLLSHLFLNRASLVDLMIDTEQEMKKVSWPSRAEVQSSSIVVVVVTFILAMVLFGFDNLLQWLFRLVLGS